MRESDLKKIYKLLIAITKTISVVLGAVAIAHPLFAVFGLLFMLVLIMGVALLLVLAVHKVSEV